MLSQVVSKFGKEHGSATEPAQHHARRASWPGFVPAIVRPQGRFVCKVRVLAM
jgi:hypothetical protein